MYLNPIPTEESNNQPTITTSSMRVGLAPPLIAVVVLDFSRQDRSSGAGDAAPPTASDLLPPSVVAMTGCYCDDHRRRWGRSRQR